MDTFDLRKYLYNNPLLLEEPVNPLTKQDVIDIGLTKPEQVDDIHFDVSFTNVKLQPGVLSHNIVEIGVFDLPDNYRTEVGLKPYHLIFGESSMAIFDAFGVNETAGLTRQACQEHLDILAAEGETEVDDAYISGLVNWSGDKLYQFFNMQTLARSSLYHTDLIPHEGVHIARSLISLFENPKINVLEPNWWENPEYAYTDMVEASEEFFAEVQGKCNTIAFSQYYKIK